VTETELINVSVTLESRNGDRATGFGSMPVGNVWAWPSTVVEPPSAEAALKSLAEATAHRARELDEWGHPIDLMLNLIGQYDELAKDVVSSRQVAEPMPKLAQLVANSPLDAAVHDAYGRLHQRSAFNVLSRDFMNHDLAHYLGEAFAGEFLDVYTARTPKPTLPLYHLVGALDPLTDGDIKERINDGLPETLGEWIQADGLTHLKIKLNGDDLAWDIARVKAIEEVCIEAQRDRGCETWFYSLDFNEKCECVEYVLDFLAKLSEASPAAMDRVQYIEQPTHRDLRKHPENKMHAAAKIKPVVIDESLIDLDTLFLSREQGYSGVALKACKGHSEALLMGAAAQKYKLFLCVQDLTCPGASFLHSASIAARLPTIAAIEGNGRQYCPVGNDGWRDRFPAMFNVTDGTVGTGTLTGPGLGF